MEIHFFQIYLFLNTVDVRRLVSPIAFVKNLLLLSIAVYADDIFILRLQCQCCLKGVKCAVVEVVVKRGSESTTSLDSNNMLRDVN